VILFFDLSIKHPILVLIDMKVCYLFLVHELYVLVHASMVVSENESKNYFSPFIISQLRSVEM